MRLIVLATGPFAVPSLRSLASSDHQICLVVSRPPRGRATEADNPVLQAAKELSLETWTPETVNETTAQERLSNIDADLLVVCDYGEILKPATLKTTRLGGINLHGSLLPKYRGAAPVQWAILKGEQKTGCTVIQMTPGLDAGPCLAQSSTPIEPDETAAELEARLAELGAPLVLKVVADLSGGDIEPIKQDAAEVTKAPRLKKQDGLIDWSRSASEIKNQVRALIPWPRAFTFWHRPQGEPLRLSVDRVSVVKEIDNQPPGTILNADQRLIVQTGAGTLELLAVQAAGKRSMSAADFLRGNRLQVGEKLGGSL